MNKLSGYKSITLKDGTEIELKFGMGALSVFGEVLGVETLEEALAQLNPKLNEAGEPVVTIKYIGVIQKLLYAAAYFAAVSQDKPVTFNVHKAANWMDEVGIAEILSVLDLGGETPKEVPDEVKKKKQPLIRASQ